MLIKKPTDIKPSEITSYDLFKSRRRLIQGGAALALSLGSGHVSAMTPNPDSNGEVKFQRKEKFPSVKKSEYTVDEELTPYEGVTSYNNFYEFATDKQGPAQLAQDFETRPWTVAIEGEVAKPKVWDVDELIKQFPLEERVYRLRCVEAWSMVIPWVGFPLGDLVRMAEPTSRAKYLRFETVVRPLQMPGQRPGLIGSSLDWPYVEGLRIDEATNPLALLAVGLYGEMMPNQNGAPIRLVVPWKYGFKSIKSIVKIQFTEEQPVNTWQQQAPREYGFYANVNPEVNHPRWSQARERRIGEFLKRPTLKFNGYEEQVASLYSGMDLAKHF